MATSTQVDALVALYAGYFNRAPDPAGLQFWIDQIDGGREFNTIAADFAASAEATALYPYLTAPDVASPSTFITSIYQNLFNRTPDQAGLDFWTDVLAQGSVSVADMIEAIINGAVDAPNATPATFDATTLENKIEVGRDFAVDAANTTGFVFNDAAKSAAIDVIDGVTNDEATVVAAKAETDAFLTGAANPGNTVTLTTGADVLVGTAGNDTFNALPVNASGGNASTFSAFDDIDGGAGTDTLNIFTNSVTFFGTTTYNGGFPSSASVENVEIININNATTSGFGAVNAAQFDGATQIWQVANANSISNLEASTTAGFRKTAVGTFGVAAATGVASAAVALEGAAEASTFNLSGDALTEATVSGTVADTDSNMTVADINLNVTAGKDVQAVEVSSAVDATLTVTNTGTKAVTSVDASASAGDITYTGAGTAVADIKTGSGDDTVTIQTTTSNVAGSEVAAMIEAGEGDDAITVATTGTGTTTVNAGAGDDTVTLTTNAGSGALNVNLGEGDDAFMISGSGVVAKGDTIDGGAGTDTVQLKDIGSANIGAFTNFEVFDAVGLTGTLDTDILASNNTVAEFAASGSVGAAAALTNVAAGAGVRITGDMDANDLEITQKTAGALTITSDIDETVAAAVTTAADGASGAVTATNATSVDVVFDSSFVGDATNTTGDNVALLDVVADKATSLSVNSGGDVAMNALNVQGDALASVTVTGSEKLDLDFTATTPKVASIDASASTGGLILDLDDMKDTGTVTLGSGDDVLVAQTGAADAAAAIAEHVKLAGFEKGAAEGLTSSADIDIIKLTAALQAADNTTGTADASVENGLITFKNAGPTTLQAAVEQAQALIGGNQAAVFEYLGNSYVFAEGATDGAGDDVLIELTGQTGLNGLDTAASGDLYVF
tara:strand:+ start:1838 stop:4543 length:2706 start_codon:yes stop_codon:yes gene_type:complete